MVVDEVHERDLHTDFFLLLLKQLLAKRPSLKVVLMSATVDPTAFQQYFPSAATIHIPGKTNYPIEEHFLEDILAQLSQRSGGGGGGGLGAYDSARGFLGGGGRGIGRGGGGGRRGGGMAAAAASDTSFCSGPLPNLPLTAADVAARLPAGTPEPICEALASAHASPAEAIDFGLIARVVEHIHVCGGDGAVLVFVPGWFEIAEVLKRLSASVHAARLELHPLHSRMPSAEQCAIFEPPHAGKRKVIISTVLAETSITVEVCHTPPDWLPGCTVQSRRASGLENPRRHIRIRVERRDACDACEWDACQSYVYRCGCV